MIESARRKWWALLLPLVAVAALLAALSPGSAKAALGTGTISGTITTSTGTALEDVDVQVYNAEDDEFYDEDTDANGAYSIPDVTDGTWYVYIDANGLTNVNGVDYASEWYGATPGAPNSQNESSATAVTVTTGSMNTVSDDLTTGATVSGTVTDQATGDALTDGYVYLIDSSGNYYDDESLPSTGTYSFQGLPSGTYYLEILGSDNGSISHEFEDVTTSDAVNDASAYLGSSGLLSTWQDGSGFTLTTGSATPTTENAVLPTATSVSGTVTTGGNPEGDVYVQAYDTAGNPIQLSNGVGEAYTAADPSNANYGIYTVNNLLPGTYTVEFVPGESDGSQLDANYSGNLAFQFYSSASTQAAATTISPTAAAPSTGINASLVTGGQITGTVTNAATGKPQDALVELLDAKGNVLEEAEDSTDGTYTLNGIPTGSWYVEFLPLDNNDYYYYYNDATSAYQPQYYGGSQTLGSAKSISVTAGSTTSGVNAAFGPVTAASPTTTVTTTTPGTTTTVATAIPTIAGTTPAISGTAKVGSTLRAVTGIWSTGTVFSYQWFAGGKAILGATASTLKLTAADYKKVISVAVVGAESGYYSTAKTSVATKAVVAGTLVAKVPTISGTKKVGDRLTAKPGIWTAGTKFTYQWYAGGKAIKGATKSTFRLAAAEESKAITVKVTGKLTGYTTVAKTSKATAKIS